MIAVLKRLVISVFAGMGAAIVSAVVIGIINIDVTGHGGRSLLTPVVVDHRLGIALGVGDIVMLAIAFGAAVAGWIVAGRAR